MENEPILASQRVRHFGEWHIGITRGDAILDKRILKALFTRCADRGTAEGVLACYVQTRKESPDFQASLARLKDLCLIEFGPSAHKDARIVLLTVSGRSWAAECASAVQLDTE